LWLLTEVTSPSADSISIVSVTVPSTAVLTIYVAVEPSAPTDSVDTFSAPYGSVSTSLVT
jgi:hypothetical protein